MVPARGIGYAFAAFSGYIGPSIAGLIAAGLISIGRIVIVLWLLQLMPGQRALPGQPPSAFR